MSIRFLGAAAVAALTAAPVLAADLGAAPMQPPAPAPSMFSGYIEAFGGFGGGSDNGPDSWNYGVYGASGRLNGWISPTMSFQLDAWINAYDASSFDYSYSSGGVGGHLSMRDPNAYLFGVLASYGANGDYDESAFNVGLEGQYYVGNLTLYGQGGYSAGDGISAWYIHGAARYFFNPNLMLEGSVGYAAVDADYGIDYSDDLVRWGAKLEWKPDAMPFSIFAAYQGHHDDWTGGYTLTEHTGLFGLRLYFGQDTLLGNDRSGATLVDYNPIFGVQEPWDAF